MSPIKVSPIIIAPESLLLHDKNRNLPFFLTIQIEFNLKIPITLAGLNFLSRGQTARDHFYLVEVLNVAYQRVTYYQCTQVLAIT